LLPKYTIRESARARHVRFRVTLSDGLVIVVPKGFDRRRIPGLLEEKRDWLARAMTQIEKHRADATAADRRPETIELPAVHEKWRLEWYETDEEKVSIAQVEPSRLHASGAIGDRSAWQSALESWLLERGREHLVPWAEDLARELCVPVQRVSVRCQKTRWGSYSARKGRQGMINLNAQLLFLPEQLVRFVLLHELCHAEHPNHSPSFWDLVRTHEPDTDRLRKELRAAWKLVPGWLAYRP
jgi:predicted metal-dependent hydrolase